MIQKPSRIEIQFLAIGIGIGIGISLFFYFLTPHSLELTAAQREVSDEFQFVNPLLSCGVDMNKHAPDSIAQIESDIRSVIAEAEDSEQVAEAGVYVENLTDGSWFSINADTEFVPGSLLKVPLAMSLLNQRAEDNSFLQGPLFYTGDIPDIPQVYPPTQFVEAGKSYSFDELLKLSLTHSDNIATIMLARELDRDTLNEAYADLGVDEPAGADYTMSVRTYASFFKILYNGTYNSPEDSNRILDLLAQSPFNDGIVAGLPEGIVVAHKFGERSNLYDEYHQLHDCGIIYGEKPYLLCIMLRGRDIHILPPTLSTISRTIYESLYTNTQ